MFLTKLRIIVSLVLIFITKTLIAQQKKLSEKETIVKNYYLFQKTEDRALLDSTLKFIKLKKDIITEDTINSKIFYLKGVHNHFLHRYKEAEKFFLKSFNLAKKTNDYLLMGTVSNARGVNYAHGENDYVMAEKLYKEAIEYYKIINEKLQQIDGYYNLTIIARKEKKWNLSQEFANNCRSLIISEKKRTHYLKRLHFLMADNCIKLKEYDKALENLKLSEKYLSSNDHYDRSLVNMGYARYYGAIGKHQKAIDKYIEVIKNQKDAKRNDEEALKNSFVRELELENRLKIKKDKIIKGQKRLVNLSFLTALLFVILSIVLILFARKNKKKNNQITELNNDLKKLINDLKEKNTDLANKKNDIESLLEFNEQSLFSRILKISTYNDAINKINDDIDVYMDKNASASGYLMTIRKKLDTLIYEDELWEDFKIQFEKIRPDFFNKLKKHTPSLSVNDLKHCTYVVLNLKSKEVAQLINVSPRSVETVRYRIKKKMGLEKDKNLHDLLTAL